MDGKLEELVSRVSSYEDRRTAYVTAADIRSISDAYKAMEAENGRLRAVLRETDCPRPCNHRPDGFSAGQCFDADECGCGVHFALGGSPRHEG